MLNELSSYASPDAAKDFLSYVEAYYKPVRKSWRGNFRLQYFETEGYNARIYTYEADIPYNFSIPFYYDKGMRYYFNSNWDASKWVNKKRKRKLDVNVWLRWAQTIYPDKTSTGTYLDEINSNHRSEIKCQLILIR